MRCYPEPVRNIVWRIVHSVIGTANATNHTKLSGSLGSSRSFLPDHGLFEG